MKKIEIVKITEVVNDDMVVLGGNMRLRAFMEIGLKEVPIIKTSDLTTDEERQFVVKDNLGYGEWNWDMLANEWDKTALEDWGMDIPHFAFKNEIIDDNFETEPPENSITKLADIYELNQHRFSCGDSTDQLVVEQTLNGAKPILMVTDPPYGVNYDPDWRNHFFRSDGFRANGRVIGLVKNDHQIDWSAAFALFSWHIVYVWHSGYYVKHTSDRKNAIFGTN